jgi:5-formyltetrahydrofolate cyclo-ligase
VDEKVKLRRELLKIRQSMTVEEWKQKSDRLCSNLQKSVIFNQANTILAFFSIRQEPDLSSLFFDSQRQWGFPRCVGTSLSWHSWKPEQPLNTGAYNIKEPHPEAPTIQPEEVDLILVPCVACDQRSYRLGYGGGYYDRLLSSPDWAKKPTIGIVFNFAYLSQIPVEPWDKPLQIVITENDFR